MGKIIKNGIEYGGGTAVVPIASASTLGAIKVGRGLSISAAGVLSRDDTPITYTALDDVTNARFEFDDINNHATLFWSDSADVPGSTGGYLAQWYATVVVRKVGSAPTSPTDGTIVCTNTVRDQYSVNGFTDSYTFSNDPVYYRFFPKTTENIVTYGTTLRVVSYPTFANATWEQISEMLTNAYTEGLDLSEIWSVGDTKLVDFSGTTKEIVILDFEYDTLTTAIGTNTKAKITCAMNESVASMTNTSNGSKERYWANIPLRTYCNGTFYDSIPSGLKSLIKPIQKSDYNNTYVSDNCSILSEAEYKGNDNYAYLKDSSNIAFLNGSHLRDLYSAGTNVYWKSIISNYDLNYYIAGRESHNVVPIFAL